MRRDEVDVLRGAELLGLSVVNVPFLAGIDLLIPPTAILDRLAAALVALLFQGKFFVLFSFLFGWGFAIQMQSAQRRGRRFGLAYGRRLAGLMVIGVAHALLVFTGDVLVLYALLGVPLWWLRNASPRRLFVGTCMLICVAAAELAGLGLVLSDPVTHGASILPGGLSLLNGAEGTGYLGSFVDTVRQRLLDWPGDFGFVLSFNGPLALAGFCAGLAAAKLDFFSPGAAAYQALRCRWPWLLAVGLLLNGLYALAMLGMLGEGVLALFAFSALALGAPCLASVYLIAVVEFTRRRGNMRSLAIAGRMSLTAYVGEGVIAGMVFNGYGLGLHGSTGDLACLGIAVLIYALVHLACVAWSRSFTQGPLEILLRAVTRGAVLRTAA